MPMPEYIAQLGLKVKGLLRKGLVICNSWDLEPSRWSGPEVNVGQVRVWAKDCLAVSDLLLCQMREVKSMNTGECVDCCSLHSRQLDGQNNLIMLSRAPGQALARPSGPALLKRSGMHAVPSDSRMRFMRLQKQPSYWYFQAARAFEAVSSAWFQAFCSPF